MPRGGSRLGAGRPKGQGRYKEPTKPIRIPESLISGVMEFVESSGYSLPLYSCSVQAGFPSPADDHMEGELDLNKYLIKHPTATFFVRAAGESMIDAGIYDGDIVVIRRTEIANSGDIVVALIDQNEVTLKRFRSFKNSIALEPANKNYKIRIFGEDRVKIQGKLVGLIRKF